MRSHWRELTFVLAAAAVWGWLVARPAPPPPTNLEAAIQQMRPDPELISGRVVSGLNGKPIPRASVVGWGPRRQVDATGHFRFAAHQNVSLLVEAPYFERQKVTLEPGHPQEIRLLPASPID